ncbi:PspC domain-containing protein [Prauserella endophytica]|uniref:PspC domain-containing protein n=1 Tax=Prauserella endophytica TaxID=1592324 RepID=A0ABY2S183_9PSEU|nr:PspC domain-containing protein [Prauserella endophytica]TKG67677.1 PspC domain-containing protein [Prauserella endophytica]
MSGATNASKHIEGFEDTVKDFWESRPRRPHQGRKLAGVAAGIGYRYGVDPVVIRVALVAMTIFGGVGISVYLLGWLLLPGEDDEVSAFEHLIGRGQSSVSKAFAVVLCLVLLPSFGWTFAGNWFDGGGFIGAALLITALYLLHRSRGHLNRPASVGRMTAATGYDIHGGQTTPHGYAAAAAGTAQPGTAEAGSWDALGAAPLGWDLPAPPSVPEPPAPAPPEPRRPRSKVGLATFGVALAVGSVGAAIAANDGGWFTAAHVLGLVLGVLGTGLVVGSFLGGGRGLVWLAAPLAAAALFLTAVPFDNFRGGVGNLEDRPTTAAEVEPVYERTAGQIELDLRQLAESEEPVRTTVRVGTGDVTVLVPRTADVSYTCDVGMGNYDCFGRNRSGIGTEPLRGFDPGPDGPGGQRITLNVEAGAGNLEVSRG